MVDQTAHEKLCRLHALLLKEREYAKTLSIDEMQAVSKEKEGLLREINSIKKLHPQDYSFAETIRKENRRNAYLFWSTLNWIRDSMEFFSQQISANAYTPNGNTVNSSQGGKLLSGKV